MLMAKKVCNIFENNGLFTRSLFKFYLTRHTATLELPEMQACISLSIRIDITQKRHVFSGLCVNFVFVSTVCFCCSDLCSLDLRILIF